jgi:hypothetical protein
MSAPSVVSGSARYRFGVAYVVDEASVLGRLAAFRPLALGVATELFAEEAWPGRVERASRWSQTAVELSALTASELAAALSYLRVSRPRVRYLSLHAPVALASGGERWLAARLSEVQSRLTAVIQHPHILGEPARLAGLGRHLLLENMDAQKPAGRVVEELEPYFRSLPEAGFCLDVAHVKTVDPSMRLGHDLIDAFGGRLRELHVSGIDVDCIHVPLDVGSIELYASVLRRCRHVPWILESLPADSPPTSEGH